ncbi:MAG: ABC transporter permease [Beijerinckiaceae bacterium]|nr:ABC transporter permease [Beijerinckiaceae bacterium]
MLDVLKDSVPRARRRDERQTALVPEASISGRALVIVVVIMTFLASMTAGAVELIATASASWSADVTREMTIQIRPRSGRDLDADVKTASELARGVGGIDGVRPYSKEESERLLEPWLGSALPFDQMPVPRIVVLSLDPKASLPDLASLKRRLAEAVPTATLDDHRQWSARLATMAGALVLVGLTALALVLIATGLAIAFATRGAMAGTREIINVLHLVGAEDRFIADEFQRHFLMMGLRGGLIGSGLAVLAFLAAGALSSRWNATPQGEQIEALFGTFALGPRGYLAVICIAFVVAGLTAIVTRRTVYRNLRDIT